MANVQCNECSREYNSSILSRCPDCNSADFKAIIVAPRTKSEEKELNFGNKGQKFEKTNKGNAASIAISSAKIVNAYGTYIQVIGIVLGVLVILGGIILAVQAKIFALAVGGIALGALDIAIFAVQGALFRMLSNYVIARLEQE